MIIIVDFGGQTAHLIGRRLRQLGVQTEYVQPDESLKEIKTKKPAGIIFTGGPDFVTREGAPTIEKEVYKLGIPILGICYGWQLMAYHLGAEISGGSKEFGPEKLVMIRKNVFDMPQDSCQVFMSHGDSVATLPEGFELVGSTARVKHAAAEDKQRKFIGVQFHPEVDHTEYGMEMLKYFVAEVCGEEVKPFVLDPQTIIADIKKKVGKQKVICAVSGGVDSTVAAALIGKAIGKNLIPVYVDSGLMRPKNTDNVKHIFSKLIPANLVIVEAKQRFMEKLAGVTDPEEKRKIIGKLYIDIFQEQAKKQKDATFLGQGTIYSDVIESKGSKHASKIKSHHNVGGLPAELGFQLIEPIRNHYKDEVREIGRLLGLPEETVMQQPVPGPGYSVRIRGEVTEKRLQQVIKADGIVMEEMKRADLYHKVFQCFAVMTGAYSTAVKGDERSFAEVVAIRAYESKDIMTSQWAQIPYEVLAVMSRRIVNEVSDVSRVVYDITTKPPATMEWE